MFETAALLPATSFERWDIGCVARLVPGLQRVFRLTGDSCRACAERSVSVDLTLG